MLYEGTVLPRIWLHGGHRGEILFQEQPVGTRFSRA